MASVIFKSVLKPKKTLFVANALLIVEAFEAFILTVLFKEPLITLICLAISHLYCIHLTTKEPHISNILRNQYFKACERIGLKHDGVPCFETKVNYTNKAEFYYEL